MKRTVAIFLSIVILSLLCACSHVRETSTDQGNETSIMHTYRTLSDDASIEVLHFYIDFLELAKVNSVDAFDAYCHYGDSDEKQMALQGISNDGLLDYQIIRIERLSEHLWVVEWCLYTEKHMLGYYGVHYVGMHNGEYRVMVNKRYIPAELKEGVTIEDYEVHGPGIIDPDDVIGAPENNEKP